MALKNVVRSAIRAMGYEVHRFHPASSHDAQLIRMLESHSIEAVLDIGANVGQFGRDLRRAGYKGAIVSFEPLLSARVGLERAIRGDARWKMAERVALGAFDGEVEVHVAANSVSSSILPMLESHSGAAPESGYVATELVPQRRLDGLLQTYVAEHSKIFMKIDTQGYEDRVLQGAERTLARSVGLRVELSLVPLYEEQLLYEEMLPRLAGLGFELWNITPAFVDPRNGRLLQVDGTFFRRA